MLWNLTQYIKNLLKCKKCEKFCFLASVCYTERNYLSPMRYILLFLIFLSTFWLGSADLLFAANEGIYEWWWKTVAQLRNGDFTINDLPLIIVWAINMLLAVAGTVSVVALIYHAVKMQLASGITGDSSWVDKAKAGMKWALLGFVLALSAWFLVSNFIQILSNNT